MSMLSIRKLSANWRPSLATILHDDWHSVDLEGFPKMPSQRWWVPECCEWFLVVCRRPRSHPELNLRRPNLKTLEVFLYPDLARNAEKVSRSVNEGYKRVSEHREDMPKHPDFMNSAFGNPSGDLVEGRSCRTWMLVCLCLLIKTTHFKGNKLQWFR